MIIVVAVGPPAEGVRIPWEETPASVRSAVESRLGAPVIRWRTHSGGFSPGLAATLESGTGRRVFVKGVGPKPNPDTPRLHRREAEVVAALPDGLPVPRMLWSFEDAASGWVVLAFEQVDGWTPRLPWQPEELDRVLEMLFTLADALTPSPIEADPIGEKLISRWRGWQTYAAAPDHRLDPFTLGHLEELARLEELAPAAAIGETLLHLDVRADNLLLTTDRVFLVDWPWVRVGAKWLDVLFFAPSVNMQGGPSCEEVLSRAPGAQTADPTAVDAVLASLAGMFTYMSLQPPPPGLPTVRAFQAAQGEVAWRWLARRKGWQYQS